MSLIHEEEFDKRHPVDWKAGHDGDTNVIANLRARVAELEATLSRSPAAATEVAQSEFDRGFLAGRACKVERPGPAGKIIAAEQPAAEPELLPLPKPSWIGCYGVHQFSIYQMHAYARAHLRAAGQGKDSETCAWDLQDDDSGLWQSSCGQAWTFIDGGPIENSVSFCHGCGKPVELDAAMKAGAQGGAA